MSEFLLIGDALRRNAYKYPLKVAAKDSMWEVTYRELNDRVNRLANSLIVMGIHQGEAAALLVGNRIEHLEILLALAKIGALAIPLDVKWRALELASTLSSLRPATLFLEMSCREEFSKAKELKELGGIRSIVLDDPSSDDLVDGADAAAPRVVVPDAAPFI